jgi:cobalamin biosynthesis Mg chelatase CobN
MTRRTVLLLIGLFCCWSAEALAQTVDTSATSTLTEQTSSVTQQVTTATQELEPVTNQVSSSAGSITSNPTDSAEEDSGTGSAPAEDSSGGTDSAEQCEIQPTRNGGSEKGSAAGGRASGGGPSASRAGPRDEVLAARRERARGEGVLGSLAEGRKPLPTPLPNAPNEFPFWVGIAVLVVLGLGFAGLAALTTHLLNRTRAG